MKFEKNIGDTDKKARLGAAAVLFLASFFIAGIVGYVLIFMAVMMVVTSVFSFCPAYTFMGLNTCCGGSCKAKKEADGPDDPADEA